MYSPTGLWLPLVTPFRDGEMDRASVRNLVRHYAGQKVDGLILAGTTGESPTLDEDETRILLEEAATEGTRLPLWLGLSGSDTRALCRKMERLRQWPAQGYLIACPSFNRPPQEGLYRHFAALAQSTDRPILVYNIPYRTGVNMANDTLLRLAELPNIVGVKDCCADPAQSFDLIRAKPAGFSVLSGEDTHYYEALCLGADGGILASAHIQTAAFADLAQGGLEAWRALADLPRLLFAEPNPAAIKYWLWRTGLIASPELRLPMMPASDTLAARLDAAMGRRG